MTQRINEIDFLRCVFILLMVAFHLVYIGDKYPYAKLVVYTFHMPAFLLISGYLLSMHKPAVLFFRSMVWLFVPYAVMESGYVLMASFLPIREHIDCLTLPLFFDKLLFHPLGPYWYLHTLLLGGITGYFLSCLKVCRGNMSVFCALLALVFMAESWWLGLADVSSLFYLGIGMILRRREISFVSFFRGTVWSLPPLLVFASDASYLNRFSLPGMLMTYFSICMSLAIFPYVGRLRSLLLFIGRNTLAVLIFSPIFTLLSKGLLPLFGFDPTGLCFLVVALSLVLTGSFGMAWLLDRCRLSRFLCGRPQMLQ